MILLSANKSSPIRCFSQLSLFHSCYQSFIPPKSQLQQMIWKTEWQTWWDFVGMKLLFVKFPFGTEMRMSQQNHEGGWSGIGMATVGIHPNDFDLYPNKIPPGRVVQNCPCDIFLWLHKAFCGHASHVEVLISSILFWSLTWISEEERKSER